MKKINVVFDMDGVIFDTESYWAKAFKKASLRFNKDFDEELRKFCCGRNSAEINKIFAEKFPDIDALEVRAFMAEYVYTNIEKDGVKLLDGAKEILQFLKKNHAKLALATGSEKNVVEKYFRDAGLDVYEIFDAMICGDMVKNPKPNPEVYQRACEKLGVNPKDCYAIEDSPNGIVSAHIAGLKPIFVVDQILPDETTAKYSIETFDNLFEVMEYLKKIN